MKVPERNNQENLKQSQGIYSVFPSVSPEDEQNSYYVRHYKKDIGRPVTYKNSDENMVIITALEYLQYDHLNHDLYLCGIDLKTKDPVKVSVKEFVFHNNSYDLYTSKDIEMLAKEFGDFAGYILKREKNRIDDLNIVATYCKEIHRFSNYLPSPAYDSFFDLFDQSFEDSSKDCNYEYDTSNETDKSTGIEDGKQNQKDKFEPVLE